MMPFGDMVAYDSAMVLHGVDIPEQQIGELCRRHRIRRLSLFGSILRDDFDSDSDVDVLVEFEAGATPGLFTFAGIALELEKLIGREVDLREAEDLSKYSRAKVVRTARTLHAA